MDRRNLNGNVEDERTAVNEQVEAGKATDELIVVGIGASAGGLEAIEKFFDMMPNKTGLAFVVVQHLSPDFKSLMSELLSRHTDMEIHRVEDRITVKPDSVYLIPPKKEMIFSNGKLLLKDKDPSESLSMPIDVFFRSLGQNLGRRSMGIVMSGTGSDGSRGIQDIKHAGGVVLVQSIESSKFDGMPRSAINTGAVDRILSPEEMPGAILEALGSPLSKILNNLADKKGQPKRTAMEEVFYLINSAIGTDFNLYKPTTIQRRIERRMGLIHCNDIQNYVEILKENPAELNLLYKDLLIGVTEFFRDSAAFDVLRDQVVPEIFNRASRGEEIRIWVAGCATGEEVYSLAIIFTEYARRTKSHLNTKIFATDIHQDSIEYASRGVYSESGIEKVSEELRAKYFKKTENGFLISSEIRKMVVFAVHNLLKDPPFTRLDLISCRNLLIYFNPIAQKKVMSLFHFSLKSKGCLFLGPSESLDELEGEFEVIQRHWKIFQKRRDIRLPAKLNFASNMTSTPTPNNFPRNLGQERHVRNELLRIYDAILDRHINAGILLNENKEIIHMFGEASKYLRPMVGRTDLSVLNMTEGEIRTAISTALQRAAKSDSNIVFRGVRFTNPDGTTELLKLEMFKIKINRPDMVFFHLTFEQMHTIQPAKADNEFDSEIETSKQIKNLEDELSYTRETLQATVKNLKRQMKNCRPAMKNCSPAMRNCKAPMKSSIPSMKSFTPSMPSMSERSKN